MEETESGRSRTQSTIRYQVDERPPTLLSVGLGAQFAILTIGGIVFTPMIVVQAAGGPQSYLNWAVFAAVLISGITTMLQAIRVGKVGAGYVLAMGTSGAFIAVCVAAIAKGGPGMLATLVIISSLFQFVLSQRLAWFRKIFSPVVSGTVIMLISVTIMPIVFDMLDDAPADASPAAAPVCVGATLLVLLVVALKAKGILRMWALVLGVLAGSAAAMFFGTYNIESVANAQWIGLPDGGWPGYDFSFGPVFWSLLPAFVFVTLIGAVETIGDGIAIQRVSWREPRAVDFRAVQGAVAADGVGNLLSGLAATVPNTTYSSSVAVTELSGAGSRHIGIVLGVIFVGFSFSPKFIAAILAIPPPVAASYLLVLLAVLFVVGMKIIIQDGIDYRKSIIVGTAFWTGVGFQNGVIFPDQIGGFASEFLQNGMTSGGLVAIILTIFFEMTQARPKRFQTELDASCLPAIREFYRNAAAKFRWNEEMLTRIDIVSEEVLLSLLRDGDGIERTARQQLLLTAKKDGAGALLEFISSSGDNNLQDQLALISEQMTEQSIEGEFSFRILKHYASSVRHQQYHDIEIVTVHVDPSAGSD